MGYSETSKAYRTYIPQQRQILVRGDGKFEQDFALKKSHESIPMIEDEKQEVLKVEPGL
jgi:hypothetical protein